jgi:hypothetical protein
MFLNGTRAQYLLVEQAQPRKKEQSNNSGILLAIVRKDAIEDLARQR